MISFFGLVLDFVLTRNWRQIAILLLPVLLIATTLVLSFVGSVMDRESLAQSYLRFGELELSDAEEGWAYDLAAPGSEGKDESEEVLSRFTESVFRKALQLQPNNERVRFVIGASLGNRGTLSHAMTIMKSLAPENNQGFLPAHAWIANAILLTSRGKLTEQDRSSIKHHLAQIKDWSETPIHLTEFATRLDLEEGNTTEALELLRKSAQKQPELEGDVFRLALQLQNRMVATQTVEKALPRLLKLIEDGQATAKDRVTLADMLFYQGDMEASRGVLEDGLRKKSLKPEERKDLLRALSELYRLRFVQTVKLVDGNWQSDPRLLEEAMRIDPTNEKISEQVAMLARLGGDRPSENLMSQLNTFLAEGRATAVTHAWIAEAHLLREEYDKAISHFESVVARQDNNASAHNNIAYALALKYDARLEEALQHADRAIELSPRVADYHDTRGYILNKLGRHREAINELEVAVQLKPGQESFHQQLVELFKVVGDQEMTAAHEKIVERIRELKEVKESQG